MRFFMHATLSLLLSLKSATVIASPPSHDVIPLSSYGLIMAHDAASGYLDTRSIIEGEVYDWTKTQFLETYNIADLLTCGVRSLDWRPSLVNGELKAHHGDITVDHLFKETLREILEWLTSNPSEFVILNMWDCASDSSGDCKSVMRELLNERSIPTIDNCGELDSMTIGDVKSLGGLPTGGSLLVVFASVGIGGEACSDANYDESIACWGDVNPFGLNTKIDSLGLIMRKLGNGLSPYTDVYDCMSRNGIDATLKYEGLTGAQKIILNNCIDENSEDSRSFKANVKGIFTYSCWDNDSSKSTPYNQMNAYLDKTTTAGKVSGAPFWQLQALWQETTASVVIGELHLSSLLIDETNSKLNHNLAVNIKSGRYKHLNLVEVNNACESGMELKAAIDWFNDITAAGII